MTLHRPKITENGLYQILMTILVLSSSIFVFVSGTGQRYHDELEYYAIATHLVEGKGFSLDGITPTAYRPPVYPALIAVCLYVSGGILLAKILNVAFIFLSALCYSKIASRLSDGSRVYVPLLFLMYPVVTYSATTLYPQLFGMLLLGWILLVIFEQGESMAGAIKAGGVLGVLILAIPGFMLCAPVICLGFLCAPGVIIRQKIIHSAWCLMVCMLVVSIWSARNYYHFGEIIPVSTNSGVNLLLGNSDYATANSGVNADISRYQDEARAMNEVEKDAYYKEQAIEWIKNNPEKALALYFKKVGNYFNYQLNLATKSQDSAYKNAVMFASYYLILLMSVGRLLTGKNISGFEKFLYFFYISNAFLAAVFFTRIRFRIPFDGVIILLAAIFVSTAISHVMKRRQSQ